MAKLKLTFSTRTPFTEQTDDTQTLQIRIGQFVPGLAIASQMISSGQRNAIKLGSDNKLIVDGDDLPSAKDFVASINAVWST